MSDAFEGLAVEPEPILSNGSNTTTPAVPPHPKFPGRRVDGKFGLRNTEALTYGGHRRQPLDPRAEETFAAWAADLGGVEELTTAERLLVQRGCEADAIAAGCLRYLKRSHQSLTSPRTLAAITAWMQATNQLRTIATALGLRRRAKSLNVAEQLARFHQERQR